LVYSFVQSHYWDVGPWRYWTISQIPNFLLATPILTLAFASVTWFFVAIDQAARPESKIFHALSDLTLSLSMALTLLPYAIHALVLSLILLTAAHVQIALRVLPAATPWISWAGAALIIQSAKHKNIVVEKSRSLGASPNGGSWWPFLSDLWIGWSVVWLLVSSVLWLAFLPPA
jgi:phosphatidylinositol glycan class V